MSKKPVGNTSSKKKNTKKPVKKVSRKFQPIAGTTRKVMITSIVICIVVVLMSLIINSYFEPSKVAERKINELAEDYYENYFYDNFVKSIPAGQSLEEAMSEMAETGFAKVLLRHLFLFDNGRNQDYAKYFNTAGYTCDRNTSYIKITPEAPFGRKNYKVERALSCNYK